MVCTTHLPSKRTMFEPASWQFVPANLPNLVTKALDGAAHVVILDLEDSVAQSEKESARQATRLINQKQDKQIWIRTNAVGSPEFEHDLSVARANPSIVGVLIPKVEMATHLPRIEELQRNTAEGLKVGLLIESALGVLNLNQVLTSGASIEMVMFGGAEQGDLMNDLRCRWSPSGIEMIHARQHVLLCARAHGVQPVDGVFARIQDLAGLEAETLISRSFGFRARASVHPAQTEVINRCYAPTSEEKNHAERLVEAFEVSLQLGKAAVQFEGRLVDYAMYRAAQRILKP